jgi:hypothetical protein
MTNKENKNKTDNLSKLIEKLPIFELDYGINYEIVELSELEEKLDSIKSVKNKLSTFIIELDDNISKKKNLSGVTVDGVELTNDEHLEYVCSKLSYNIDYVDVGETTNKNTLSLCEGMIEELISRCEGLLDSIKDRLQELDEEDKEENTED